MTQESVSPDRQAGRDAIRYVGLIDDIGDTIFGLFTIVGGEVASDGIDLASAAAGAGISGGSGGAATPLGLAAATAGIAVGESVKATTRAVGFAYCANGICRITRVIDTIQLK